MVKLVAPLMSESASGTVADVLTFSNRKTGAQVRRQRKQKDVVTDPRTVVRTNFRNASDACRFMEFGVLHFGVAIFGNEIYFYAIRALGKTRSAYNQCIADYNLITQ